MASDKKMANDKKIVTRLGKPEIHRVLIRGHDLTNDLVGKITFRRHDLFNAGGAVSQRR